MTTVGIIAVVTLIVSAIAKAVMDHCKINRLRADVDRLRRGNLSLLETVAQQAKTIKELKARLNWLTCPECDHDTTCTSPDKCDRNKPHNHDD